MDTELIDLQKKINSYYDKQIIPLGSWKPQVHDIYTKLPESGYAIIDKISQEESVIDIGCGTNILKPFFKNFLGIDPNYDEADIRVSLQDFVTDQKFDVALCLGSLNHGNRTIVKNQIQRVINLLTPTGRIYFRGNPNKVGDSGLDLFGWTPRDYYDLAEELNFNVVKCVIEKPYPLNPTANRIYAEWRRKE